MRCSSVAAAAAFVVFGVALGVQDVQAAPITFQGSTLGSFNANTPASTATLHGLSYLNSSFNVTTSNDFAALGNEAGTGPGGSNVNNLGSLSLTGSPASYNGNTFAVQVTFTSPTGIASGNPASISANVTGSVSSTSTGGVLVDFNNAPVLFSFNDGSQSGTFTLVVNDVAATAGASDVPITGQIVAVVPEPATALLGGLGMLALASRRRRATK